METLENIGINLSLEEIGRRLHIKKGGDFSEVKRLVEVAQPMITGRAIYRVSYIDEKFEDAVNINGVRLTSRVLRKNLDNVGRVFPYAVTIGNQLEEKISECKDLLEKYYLDTIGNIALAKTRQCLEDQLQSRYAIDGMSFMSPGSLKDWPIEEQRNLFSILGDTETSIGVTLNESLLMIPRKSVSGIYFPTEITFYSCQLCNRERCVGRKARYNEKLTREYGIFK